MPVITFKLPGGFSVDVGDTPSDGQVLTFNSAISLWDAQTPAGGGEDNTSSNSGAGDGWALAKVGVDLPFKSLITTSPLATTSNASDLTITIDDIAFTLLADGTDGELITWDANGVVAAVAVGTSGQVLTSNGVGAAPTFQAAAGGGKTFARVVKKVDETVTSSITLQDDDELFIALNTSKTYGGFLVLWLNSGTTPDFKYSFTLPTGATGLKGFGTLSSTVFTATADLVASLNNSTDGSDQFAVIPFRVIMDTTAGNLQFQFAQAQSNAGDTKCLEGSTLVIWEETA